MKQLRTLLALTLATTIASAPLAAQTSTPGLTGTWTGAFVIQGDNGPQNQSIHMVAKQTGADLTGTAGPSPERQWPMAKGKVTTTKDGTSVAFEVASDGPIIQFELKLVDGHLKGTAKAEQDGRKLNATVDIQRAK